MVQFGTICIQLPMFTFVSYCYSKLTLILSASIDVLATKIFAFSTLFGWLTPIFLSSKNPVKFKSTDFKISSKKGIEELTLAQTSPAFHLSIVEVV